MKSKIPVSVVIPTYNDSAISRGRVEEVDRIVSHTCTTYELLIIDDASVDGNTEEIASYAKGKHHIRLLVHPNNRGIAPTMHELFTKAKYEHVVLFSLDLEWDARDIPKLIAALSDADIVVGHRVVRAYLWHRTCVSLSLNALNRIIFGVATHDSLSIKAMKKHVFQSVPTISTSVYEDAERIIRAVKRGYRLKSVPVSHRRTPKLASSTPNVRMIAGAVLDMARVFVDININGNL